MPGHYERKTPKVCSQAINEGVEVVLERGISQRQVCKDFNVLRATLQQYLKEYALSGEEFETNSYKGLMKNRVFTNQMEMDLEEYLLQASRQLHGLT